MPLSIQEVFDAGVKGLRKQKSRAVNNYDTCVYRASNGNKCFIGFSIPDDKYSPDMEDLLPDEVLNFSSDWRTLQRMQSDLHDTIRGKIGGPNWEKTVELFAERYNLTVPAREENQ